VAVHFFLCLILCSSPPSLTCFAPSSLYGNASVLLLVAVQAMGRLPCSAPLPYKLHPKLHQP
jgi:hypothetical protein